MKSKNSIITRFGTSNSGNFALMFALLLVPMVISIGVAIDFARQYNTGNQLQTAVDAAALQIAQKTESLSDTEALSRAEKLIAANFKGQAFQLNLSRTTSTVKITGQATLPTTFLSILDIKKLYVTRVATANVAQTKFEIALVLDTTGSMEGGKLNAMKAAAKTLVDDLDKQVIATENLKFALVPFATFVNVGPQYGAIMSNGKVTQSPANWIDALGQSPITQQDLGADVSRFALYSHLGHTWKGCIESRPKVNGVDYAVTDTAPDASKPYTLFIPTFAADEPGSYYYMNSWLSDSPATIRQQTWNERRTRYGVNYTSKPTTLSEWAKSAKSWASVTQDNSASAYYSNYHAAKGPNFMCETQAITPLTSDYTKVKSAIDALVAAGNTNILEGAAWGWRVLSPNVLFTEGLPARTSGLNKIMVLLTDGTNFFGHTTSALGSAYTSFGFLVDGRLDGITTNDATVTTAAMDAKTLQACTNAKADGVEIYTILLEESNSKTSALLEKCATNPAHFIPVPDRSGLAAAFAAIKTGITQVKLDE